MALGMTVCVGLDSDVNNPKVKGRTGQIDFNVSVIDATAPVALAYKPNIAFYEGLPDGVYFLRQTLSYLNQKHPDIPVILDCKRGDIDNTNAGYIELAFGYLGVDAVTVHWYMGLQEGMRPFIDCTDKGIFVLCRTSNAGAAENQSRRTEVYPDERERWGIPSNFLPMYQVVAHMVVNDWNVNGNCGLVVGATAPAELDVVRRIVGDDMPILIPGLGKQQGDARATVLAGRNSQGEGMVINYSRGIIFAKDPGQAARDADAQIRGFIDETRKWPSCHFCGNVMQPAGSMFACPSCGETSPPTPSE